MATLTERVHDGEFILSMANRNRSMDNGLLTAGSGVVPAGMVLGQVTATGDYGIYDNAATDGRETAAGILWGYADATTNPIQVAVVMRDAEVDLRMLNWNGQAQPAIDAGVVDLRANGIIPRAEV